MCISIKKTLIGIAFTIIVGTFLHYIFDLSNKNLIVGFFGAVNESTWEHLKLLFMPFLLFSIAEFFVYGKSCSNYIIAAALAVLAGMAAIISAFYTYTGIIGKNYIALDIIIYVFGVALTFYLRNRIIKSKKLSDNTSRFAGTVILLLLAVSFIVFTVFPPQIALFRDPVTLSYGIYNYKLNQL